VEEALPTVLDEVQPDFFEHRLSGEKSKTSSTPNPASLVEVKEKRKLSYKEKALLQELEKKIPTWEKRIKELDKEIAANADSYSAIKEHLAEKEKVERELEKGLEQWAELEELKESLS
jgi:septation ring formation regulator EzrA